MAPLSLNISFILSMEIILFKYYYDYFTYKTRHHRAGESYKLFYS